MALPPALLTYAVTPSTVEYSGSDTSLSIVQLTLTATNGTTEPVSCTGITIDIPYDPNAVPIEQNALTHDPGSIVAVPGDSTPWAIWGRGDSTWHAVPIPPATAIAPGQQLSFVFNDVIVNQKQGPVTIDIDELSEEKRAGSAGLTKSGEAAGQSAPTITQFTVTPAQIALGGQVTVDWQTANATSCSLDPGPQSLPTTSGTMPLPVHETTTFTLNALSSGGTASESAIVSVMPVAITSFTATPSTVAPSGTVTLAWETQFAAGCSLGPGVGPVPMSGSTQVQPLQTTVYSLNATGFNPQTRAVTVTVAES